jgi:hypothetical protein
MLIGYARTSTTDQEAGLEAQERDLRAVGVERLYSEQVSSVATRDQLELALDYAREGDVLVVTKLDRLARSISNLCAIVDRLTAKGEAPPADLINRIADEMHVPLHEAVDKINAISMATRAQFTVLARSMNLDADKAADWIKTNRRDSAMAVAQAHTLRRDLMAWKPLLEDYRRATGDGVKH